MTMTKLELKTAPSNGWCHPLDILKWHGCLELVE